MPFARTVTQRTTIKITNNIVQTALVKNKAAQIISSKAHQNPVYYEKKKEGHNNLIREQKEKRMEDADYFSYKKILQELLEEKKERNELGFSNMFEFAVYEELLKITKEKETSKSFTKKISEGIQKETGLVG